MSTLDDRLNSLSEDQRTRLLARLRQRPADPATAANPADRAGASDVRALYEQYPFPLPADADPLYDIAMTLDLTVKNINGWEVLDAGCGTGHRLVGLARAYPGASFLGVDFSEQSLAVARALARSHGCENVEFRHAEIGGAPIGRQFDLVTSTGVIHHLERPAAGADWVQRHVRPDGISYTWYYHPYGEFDRLLNRDLVQLLRKSPGYGSGEEVLADLDLTLSLEQYGPAAHRAEAPTMVRAVIDADAYLHPIVNAYRFREAAEFFRSTSDWVVLTGINWDGGAVAIDATDWSGKGHGTLGSDALFTNARAQSAFSQLDPATQLDCLEVRLRPTGFTLVSGKDAGLAGCANRVAANARHANLLQAGGR